MAGAPLKLIRILTEGRSEAGLVETLAWSTGKAMHCTSSTPAPRLCARREGKPSSWHRGLTLRRVAAGPLDQAAQGGSASGCA